MFLYQLCRYRSTKHFSLTLGRCALTIVSGGEKQGKHKCGKDPDNKYSDELLLGLIVCLEVFVSDVFEVVERSPQRNKQYHGI